MNLHVTFNLLPVAGAFLSILGFFLDNFTTWFSSLKPGKKQLLMLGLIVLGAAVASALSYFGLVTIYPTDQGWIGLIWYPLVDVGVAICVNAGIYKSGNYLVAPKDKTGVG